MEFIDMDRYWELTKRLPNNETHGVVTEFLLSLKLANRSKITITLYRRFLEKFFGQIEEPFSSLTSDTIHQWFIKHEGKGKETTLRLRLSVLSSFYTFCIQEEYLDRSPIKSRWFPRLSKPVPKYLEKDDIAKTRFQSEKLSLRDQLLIEFMLSTGCRVGEVHSLNREDLDMKNRTARVMGKGKKIRYVHFTDRCAVLLERYLITIPKTCSALFVNSTGRRLGIRMIQKIVNGIGEEAGLHSRLYPHRLRHTFATELLAKGADISFIGEELGHRDIGTTQIYARLPKSEIVALYRKYMG
ncbi:tyrosine-type recombinase/integrase [Alkalihalophilus pseudofirmus]|uniref:tyrosine-type recombinase/integrase n=1 Tax=Alkalihalophilus pseudofirmus TaxID=79885 RepID=UPI00259B6401|nr:tyrosine-type recombinase/integrase [Alkalihalophilus pseudofirmus]WEG16709.1 tyrosine-type recombinase/integrase [Alkalihalophilus pseudofirmus]